MYIYICIYIYMYIYIYTCLFSYVTGGRHFYYIILSESYLYIHCFFNAPFGLQRSSIMVQTRRRNNKP